MNLNFIEPPDYLYRHDPRCPAHEEETDDESGDIEPDFDLQSSDDCLFSG